MPSLPANGLLFTEKVIWTVGSSMATGVSAIGHSASAIVSSAMPEEVVAVARRHGVPARVIGRVRPVEDGFSITVGTRVIRAPVADLSSAYHDAIPNAMKRSPAETVAADVAVGAPA